MPSSPTSTTLATTRQKFLSARAFYLTVLVISILTGLSLIKSRGETWTPVAATRQLFSRADSTLGTSAPHVESAGLVRRDEAVRIAQMYDVVGYQVAN